jgi:L,D-transpeptidase YbiS
MLRRLAILLLATALALTGGLLALRLGESRARTAAITEAVAVPGDPRGIDAMLATLDREVKALQTQNRRLEDKLARLKPKGIYIVIDTGADHLYVMQDDKVLRDAICSTGSGVRLADPNTPRSWIFDTPRGELTVRGKTTDPIWVKPDWAFIETGENIPRGRDDRMEEGVLGDYALDLGQGYLIHGTLFERALGLHVTHGCVRMGAKDLEFIFRTVRPGTKVYIV